MTDAHEALAQVREVMAAGISTDDDSPVTVAKWVKSVGPVNVAAILAHVDAQAAEIERLTAERDDLRRLLSEWLRENSPGGWIDELRRQLADAIRERDELRGLIDAHNADCIARCEAMSTQAGHAGVCSHYTNRGRTCPNCPRDEMIAQADAALGAER